MSDNLESWERWPVGALFVAQGLYVAEWYAGARLAVPAGIMAWVSTLGGLAAFVAIDGAMIATVAGMRAGRRGWWSVAAIVVTALFGALVALSLHGALPTWVDSWLHAGFAATITTYLLHLAQPRAIARDLLAALREEAAAERERAADLAQTIAELRGQLAGERERPVIDVRTAARILVDAGAPESTIRGWLPRLKEVEE